MNKINKSSIKKCKNNKLMKLMNKKNYNIRFKNNKRKNIINKKKLSKKSNNKKKNKNN